MRTERGFSRLVAFSDGVVAIAITLLILPLVTSASELRGDVPGYLAENAFQFFVFVLSFAVIGRFWLVHHQMYERVVGYSIPLVWANLFWLLTIVFLPFPTQLLVASDRGHPLTYGLYVGTMVLTSVGALLQQWIIVRTPELQAVEARGTLRLLPFVSILVILLVALAATLLFADVGLLSLLLLALATPIERLIDRRTRSAT